MRKRFVVTLIALLGAVSLLGGTAAVAGGAHGRPTFFNDSATPAADPYVLWDKKSGYYYAYSTEGADAGYHFGVYRSPDLGTWEKVPGGAVRATPQWGNDWFWAPEVYHNPSTGKYFLFYAARMNKNVAANFRYADFEEPCKIGVAVADSPAGPFHNIADRPIDYYPYDPDYHDVNLLMDKAQKKPPATLAEGRRAPLGTYIPSIDPNVYFGPNGETYLYFSRNAYRNWVWDKDLGKYIEESNIYAVQLDSAWWRDPHGSTMPRIAPRYVNANKRGDTSRTRRDGYSPILNYGSDKQSWENAHVDDYRKTHGQNKDRRWEEGSTTIRRTVNGKPVYYLTYSANNFASPSYGVGYATSSSPLGPFRKSATNPVLTQNAELGMYSTGHGSVISSPDRREQFYVHHARNSVTADRSLYTEPLTFARDATLSIGQSVSDTPLPSGVAPLTLRTTASTIRSGDRVGWQVRSAPGGRFFLGNKQNRVTVTGVGRVPVSVDRDADGAVLSVPAGKVGVVRLGYQRERAAGGYYDVPQVSRTVVVRG
jgi:hypothetical protein